jgi:hypothetical protein
MMMIMYDVPVPAVLPAAAAAAAAGGGAFGSGSSSSRVAPGEAVILFQVCKVYVERVVERCRVLL